jgi:hypothetical protein
MKLALILLAALSVHCLPLKEAGTGAEQEMETKEVPILDIVPSPAFEAEMSKLQDGAIRSDEKQQPKPFMLSGLNGNVVGGFFAGTLSAMFVCPLDVVRYRQQASLKPNSGLTNMLMEIARKEGLPGLYSGLGPTCLF